MPADGEPHALLHEVPSGLFTDSPVPMAVVDAGNGTTVSANRAFAGLVEATPFDAEGLRLDRLDPSGDLAEHLLLAAAAGDGEPRRRTWRTLTGREVPVELRALPLGPGRRTLLLLHVRDASPEARAERERQHLESRLDMVRRDDALTGLAPGIAHDFKNLLSVILPTVESLRLRFGEDADPELREDLEAISDAVLHARELADALLTLGGEADARRRRVGLNDVVVGMESIFRRTLPAGIDLVLKLCPGQAAVNVDPTRMEQVLLNLVTNAREAMPTGGHLLIRTDEVELDAGETADGPLEPGPHALLEISDSGEGMEEATARRMFRPYFSTRTGRLGGGLGLAIVREIVEGSGGRIDVSSAPGHGTAVRILLPRVVGAPRRRRHTPRLSAGSVPTGSEHILLVEDDPGVRRQTARLLSALGYTVTGVGAPEQALTFHAELWGEEGEHPVDLLVTDLVMPGMSGAELVRELRVTRPDLPVVYVSGHQDALDVEGRLPPAGAYLAKPFTLRALGEKVREALDG
jgi:PAS domain S-box-containing protein